MRRGLIAGLLACGLSACGAQGEFEWTLSEGPGPELKLAYGVPETDSLGLWMACSPGSPTVRFGYPGDPEMEVGRRYGERWTTDIHLRSASSAARYLAHAEIGDMGASLSAETGLNDRVLGAFEATGKILVDEMQQDADTDRERQAIRTFFAGCRGKPAA